MVYKSNHQNSCSQLRILTSFSPKDPPRIFWHISEVRSASQVCGNPGRKLIFWSERRWKAYLNSAFQMHSRSSQKHLQFLHYLESCRRGNNKCRISERFILIFQKCNPARESFTKDLKPKWNLCCQQSQGTKEIDNEEKNPKNPKNKTTKPLEFDLKKNRAFKFFKRWRRCHPRGSEGKEIVLKNGNSVPGAARSSAPGVWN